MKYRLSIIALLTLASSVFLASCISSGSSGGAVGSMVLEAPYKLINARIEGRVMHLSEGLPFVDVRVRDSDIITKTDENGNFRLDYNGMTNLGVTSLRIHLIASAKGFRSRTKGLMIVENATSKIEIKLLPVEQD